MKGTIFISLQEFVEQNHGYEVWDNVIESTDLASNGIYTSTKNYPDEELFALVGALSSKLNVSVPDLVRLFGEFLFPVLLPFAPPDAKNAPSLRAFLLMVDEVIHVEVKKLYTDSNLPEFDYDEHSDNELIMIYRSPRKLCHLSEGLIQGAAKHFNQPIEISQPKCMHMGADVCHIKVIFND